MNDITGLFPTPKSIVYENGFFTISEDTLIIIHKEMIHNKKWLTDLQKTIEDEIGITVSISSTPDKERNNIVLIPKELKCESKEAYEIDINSHNIILKGQYEGLFYGLKTLKQLILRYKNKLPAIKIKDEPTFHNRGWMIDISRGRVPKIEYLMEIVDLASDFKINMLQLYIEHTFMFEFTSEINIGKDGLNSEDILILDEYCKEHMVQLVPCIATFGHLYEILKSDSYKYLCEYDDYPNEPYDWMKRQLHHTLDCTNPESLVFIKKVLHNFVPLFSSPIVNICGDETFDIGKGKNKELAEKVGTTKLYIDFLKSIMGIIENMGKKVMFFGDMIIKHPEFLQEIPKDVICMNWNYDPEVTEDDTHTFSKSGVMQYVCPGTLGWNRALNDYNGAYLNISKLIQYGQKYKADGVLITEWGDFGNINFISTSLPSLILGAVNAWNTSEPNYNSLKEYNNAIISFLGFDGMENLNPLPILAEISNMMNITWEHLMKWYFDVAFGNVSYGNTHDFILEPECSLYKETIVKLDILIETLDVYKCKAYRKLNHSRRQDLNEAVHMAKLVKLWQHLGLFIKVFYFETGENNGLKDYKLRLEASNLASEIEKWQLKYEKLWRVRNKESELHRIREIMASLCHYLREPEIFIKENHERYL